VGLYLCIFDEHDEDVDGVEVGSYADFAELRDYLVGELEGGEAGARFPTLNLHSDCDGEWSPGECERLRAELHEIAEALRTRPAIPFTGWHQQVARSLGLVARDAFESFIDVDGEPLIGRMQALVDKALRLGRPIVFQ
jgi:glycosyltransferase involved in cell wall biosynthesis